MLEFARGLALAESTDCPDAVVADLEQFRRNWMRRHGIFAHNDGRNSLKEALVPGGPDVDKILIRNNGVQRPPNQRLDDLLQIRREEGR